MTITLWILGIAALAALGVWLCCRRLKTLGEKQVTVCKGTPLVVFITSNGTSDHIVCKDDLEVVTMLRICQRAQEIQNYQTEEG